MEVCKKDFTSDRKFAAGIYSIGCGCARSTTLGFELMINCEGPKNLFRILQCRDVDMKNLKAIIVDHACQLDSYILNREADMLQYKLLLVDGSHWYGQKKMKKSSSQNTGHLGCIDGFNFNKIKASLKTKIKESE